MTHDKHQKPIHRGDTVSFVIAGHHYEGVVHSVEPHTEHGPTPHVTVRVHVTVPAPSVTVTASSASSSDTAGAPEPANTPRQRPSDRSPSTRKA
jgi:hypothetical protein